MNSRVAQTTHINIAYFYRIVDSFLQQSNIFTQSSAPFKYINFAMVEPVVPGTINKYLSHLLINQSLIVRLKGKKKNSVLNTEFSESDLQQS